MVCNIILIKYNSVNSVLDDDSYYSGSDGEPDDTGYHSGSDEEQDAENGIILDDDELWEPETIVGDAPPAADTSVPLPDDSGPPPSPSSASSDPALTNAGRQNIENNLRQPVFTEEYTKKYPNSHAGQPLPDTARKAPSFTQYSAKISGSDNNPYAPFANKINWDIARWAKLRGPGSNSLAELLAVEGVSSFYNL